MKGWKSKIKFCLSYNYDVFLEYVVDFKLFSLFILQIKNKNGTLMEKIVIESKFISYVCK